MFENWLIPTDKTKLTKSGKTRGLFQEKIIFFTGEEKIPEDIRIGLLGIDSIESDAVRKELFKMDFPFENAGIIDFGNLRKNTKAFIIPVIKELLESKIIPLIIGRDASLSVAQIQGHSLTGKSIDLAFIEKYIPFHFNKGDKKYFLNEILSNPKSNIEEFSLIGCQSHFVDNESREIFAKENFACIGLGETRADFTKIEPLIRNSNTFCLDISTIKSSEAPGQRMPSPTGFLTEEACKLSYYAGISEKISSAGFYGFRNSLDRRSQTAQIVAQLIWYFLSGFSNRQNDYPVSVKGMVEYVVDIKDWEMQVSFWKSKKTDRWWIQVPIKVVNGEQKHKLIPCSYNDYLEVSQGEIPDRIFNIYEKYRF